MCILGPLETLDSSMRLTNDARKCRQPLHGAEAEEVRKTRAGSRETRVIKLLEYKVSLADHELPRWEPLTTVGQRSTRLKTDAWDEIR